MCKGDYWIIRFDGTAVPCECQKKRLLTNRIKFADIPDGFAEATLDNFSATYYTDKKTLLEAEKYIKAWLDNFREMEHEGIGLYLYSNTKGSGKTRMAASIANYLMNEYDAQVKFVTSLDIISEIKATWDKTGDTDFQSESQLMNYLNTTQVLFIDDFGTEKHNNQVGWLDDKFYQIINTRYTNRLITIFTSNFSLADLKYDDRIINRIKERTYPVHFPEESVRDLIAESRLQELVNKIGG